MGWYEVIGTTSQLPSITDIVRFRYCHFQCIGPNIAQMVILLCKRKIE